MAARREAADIEGAYRGRRSRQRRAIAEAADGSPSAFSVADLTAAVRPGLPGIGAATVYRAVSAMEASGFIEAVGTRDGAVIYARCRADGHHHHVVCTGCGTVAEADCPVDGALERAARASGFTLTRHDLMLYGLCASCAREG